MSTSLIISTVNGYLKSIGAAPKYMGYVMAGYALGGIISAPLYGYIADKIQSLRFIIHSSIAFKVVAYILYLESRSLLYEQNMTIFILIYVRNNSLATMI